MLCLVQGITGTAAGDRNSKINSSDGLSTEKLDNGVNGHVKWGTLRKSRYLCLVVVFVCDIYFSSLCIAKYRTGYNTSGLSVTQ